MQDAFDPLNPGFWKPYGTEDSTPADASIRKTIAAHKVDVLKERYGRKISMDFGVHAEKELGPVVGPASLDLEYNSMLSSVQQRVGIKSTEGYWGGVITDPNKRKHMPGFAALAQIALTYPLTNVEYERTSSLTNFGPEQVSE